MLHLAIFMLAQDPPAAPPPPLPPFQPDYNMWEVTSVALNASGCGLRNQGRCITSGDPPADGDIFGGYLPLEQCTFTALDDLVVSTDNSRFFYIEDPVEGYFFDYIELGGNRYAGLIGPYNVVVSKGQIVLFVSDEAEEGSGFQLCATLAPSPPTPQLPPLPPLAPNGAVVSLPRLDAKFAIAPLAIDVLSADGERTAIMQGFMDAVMQVAGCGAAPPDGCEFALTPAESDVEPSQDSSHGFVTSVAGRISWPTVNRTVLCPPPPPKAPGAVDLEPRASDAACHFTNAAPSGVTARAKAALAAFGSTRLAAQAALNAAGLPSNFVLMATPTLALRLDAPTDVTFPPSAPSSPSQPPPPPSPPNPPAPPPGVCRNTCNIDLPGGSNGVCEDGARGAAHYYCAVGTDCADCGVRVLCTTCKEQCQERNNLLLLSGGEAESSSYSGMCLQDAYMDGQCTPACNNRECGYDGGDCSSRQIEAQCVNVPLLIPYETAPTTLQQRLHASGFPAEHCTLLPAHGGVDAATANLSCSEPSKGLVPVALQMNLAPMRLYIHETFKEMQVLMELEYRLQWEDDRIRTHPCLGAFEDMVSMVREVARSDNARSEKQKTLDQFWIPQISALNLLPGYDVIDQSAVVDIARTMPWLDGIGPYQGLAGAPEACGPTCVVRTAEVELEVMQHFDFFFYPFDVHKLHITVAVEGAHLFTCDNRTALQAMLPLEETDVMASKLLPLTKEWMLTGSIMALNMFHPTIDGHLDLTISRSFLVFFVKMMLTSVIVVSGSLITALYMHPEEHANRCNVLFIAFLILVYNMQVDLGLGAITQLLWLDVFNIVQSCLVLVAVGESTIVHLLLKGKQDSLAISIDRVLRVTIPFVLYPLTTLALILWGLDQWSLCPDTEACGVSTTDPLWADRSKLLHGWTMSEIAAFVGIFDLVATTVISVLWTMRRYQYVAQEQAASVIALIRTAHASHNKGLARSKSEARLTIEQKTAKRTQAWQDATERVFRAFDLDDSGTIDFKELRMIFQSLYPLANAALMREALHTTRDYVDSNGEVDMGTFGDALSIVMEFMGKAVRNGDKSARPLQVKAAVRKTVDKVMKHLHVADMVKETSTRMEDFLAAPQYQKMNAQLRKHLSVSATSMNFNLVDVAGPAAEATAKAPAAEAHAAKPEDDQDSSEPTPLPAVVPVPTPVPTGLDPGPAPPASMPPGAAVIVRSSGGGWLVGKVSAGNVPGDVAAVLRHVQMDNTTLLSTLLATLVSRGFQIVSQTALPPTGASNGAGEGSLGGLSSDIFRTSSAMVEGPEMVYTLIGPAADFEASIELVERALSANDPAQRGHPSGSSATSAAIRRRRTAANKPPAPARPNGAQDDRSPPNYASAEVTIDV